MKKLFPVLVLTILLLNLGLAVQAKPDRVVDRVVYVHREESPPGLAVMNAKPVGSAKPLYKWSGLHWNSLDIVYYVNVDGSGIDPDVTYQTIVDSFETWDVETNAEVFLTGSRDGSKKASTVSDGDNVVSFGDLGGGGTIGVTYIWYYRDTKEVVEVDTIFNIYYEWSTDQTYKTMDLQNIATHEFGHWLVLDDLYTKSTNQQTMYGYSTFGDIIKRDLASGDVAGIEAIYGP